MRGTFVELPAFADFRIELDGRHIPAGVCGASHDLARMAGLAGNFARWAAEGTCYRLTEDTPSSPTSWPEAPRPTDPRSGEIAWSVGDPGLHGQRG